MLQSFILHRVKFKLVKECSQTLDWTLCNRLYKIPPNLINENPSRRMQARMHRAERAPDAEELAHPTLPFPLPAKRILHWRITCLFVPSRLPDFDSGARCRSSRSTAFYQIRKSFIPPLLLLRASLPDVKRRITVDSPHTSFIFHFFRKKVYAKLIFDI